MAGLREDTNETQELACFYFPLIHYLKEAKLKMFMRIRIWTDHMKDQDRPAGCLASRPHAEAEVDDHPTRMKNDNNALSESAMRISYKICHEIAKELKTFNERNFIKRCLITLADELCPQQVGEVEAIRLSRRTVVRRLHSEDMVSESKLDIYTLRASLDVRLTQGRAKAETSQDYHKKTGNHPVPEDKLLPFSTPEVKPRTAWMTSTYATSEPLPRKSYFTPQEDEDVAFQRHQCSKTDYGT
ncbi:hypothetical protein ANN_27085 [Periplaneta americana]|uniref:Uncharacterized protein n=1 Tax=Periplaneta americana TaxID=6978 RepID=A0ABQ8RX69_PERAM|nr:hypothetical protein ANN_27085 [Periplaneta americana]